MEINKLMYDPGPAAYYTDELRQHFDDQLPLLRVAQSTKIISVDPMMRFRRIGDLYGLFTDLGIAPKLHYVVLRTNALRDRFDVPDSLEYLMVPDEGYLGRIMGAVSGTKRLN